MKKNRQILDLEKMNTNNIGLIFIIFTRLLHIAQKWERNEKKVDKRYNEEIHRRANLNNQQTHKKVFEFTNIQGS